MSDLLPQAGIDVVESETPTADVPTIIAKLRDEVKQWKSKARESDEKWKTAEPVLTEYQKQQEAQKSEAQKMADQLAAANKAIADSQAAAERAQRETQVTRLATKAGVDLDLIPYLDLSKLDLTDEAAALTVLGKLAAAKQTANSASNPGRNGATGPTDAELRNQYFNGGGRNRTTIFGG